MSNASTTASFPEHGAARSRWGLLGWSFALVLGDFIAGPQYAVSLFFVLPVIWAAWHLGLAFACWLAVILSLMRFGCNWWWGFPLDFSPAVTNNVLRGIMLILVAILTERLAVQFRQIRQRMKRLEARLPVCQGCGLVQRRDGQWGRLDDDSALAESAAKQLCPECEQKRYGA